MGTGIEWGGEGRRETQIETERKQREDNHDGMCSCVAFQEAKAKTSPAVSKLKVHFEK